MPLHPDSPNLIPASPTFRSGSPVRSMHSRNLSALANGDDRITEVLDLAKSLRDQTQSVEDSVREALIEFGGLAHRSRDNGIALTYLKEHVKKTEDTAVSTESAVKDNLLQVQASLDTQKESQRALTTVTDALLESTRDINRQLQRHDAHFKNLLTKASSSSSSSDHKESARVIQEITSDLEYRHQSLTSILQAIQNNMPDGDYILDVLRQRLDRTAADQSKSLGQISDDIANLSSKIEETNSTDNSSSKVLSTVEQSSLLLENLTQRVDRSAADQAKAARNLADELALLSTKVTSNHRKSNSPDMENTLKKLVESLSTKIDSSTAKHEEALKGISINSESSLSKDQFDELLAKFDSLEPEKEVRDKLHNLVEKVDQLLALDRSETLEKLAADVETLLSSSNRTQISSDELKKILQKSNTSNVDLKQTLDNFSSSTKKDLLDQVKRSHAESMEKILSRYKQKNPVTGDELKKILDDFSSSTKQELLDHVTGSKDELVQALEKAQQGSSTSSDDSVTELQKVIDELKTSHSESNNELVKAVEKLLADHKQATTTESSESSGAELQKMLDDFSSTKKGLLDQVKNSHSESKSELSKVVEKLSADISANSVKEVAQELLDQIKNVRSESKEEFAKVLENVKSSLLPLSEKLDNTSDKSSKQLDDLLKQLSSLNEKPDASVELTKLLKALDEKISSSHEKDNKALSDIQSDIRSLIDFQYGDAKEKTPTDTPDTKQKLDEAEKRAVSAEAKNTELEKQLREAKEALELSKKQVSELESKAASKTDNDKDMKNITGLREEVAKLEQQKGELNQDISAMKNELKIRMEEFDRLESRVSKFEERLNQTILDRSKGILGSTTMTIINNTPKSGGTSPERKQPLKQSSGSRRNLSFAPDEMKEDLEDAFPVGKENELNVAKRGSPFSKKGPGRSISLFVDH